MKAFSLRRHRFCTSKSGGKCRALAQEVCAAYTEKLKADPSYGKMLYKELANYWHRNNKKNRGKLEPLSYFDTSIASYVTTR